MADGIREAAVRAEQAIARLAKAKPGPLPPCATPVVTMESLGTAAKTSEDAAEWARKRLQPQRVDKIVDIDERPATVNELKKLAEDFGKIPVEIRRHAEGMSSARFVVVSEKHAPMASGGRIWLTPGDLKLGATAEVTKHELGHAFVNYRVIDKAGGADKVWREIQQAKFRTPIHTNAMWERNGRSAQAGADEFMQVVSDDYRSGMTVDAQARILSDGALAVDAEAMKGSGQIGYMGSKRWSFGEAKEAVLLWRTWFGI